MFNFVIAALLQLSFFMLAEAAPVSAMSAKPWQAGTGGGIVGFIVLVLDIIAWSKSLSRVPVTRIELEVCSLL
jgi:uncharacterized membrane protein